MEYSAPIINYSVQPATDCHAIDYKQPVAIRNQDNPILLTDKTDILEKNYTKPDYKNNKLCKAQ